MATKDEKVKLALMKQKIDNTSSRVLEIEKKLDKTHNAVLQLPQTLAEHFVTRMEHKVLADEVKSLREDKRWIIREVIKVIVPLVLLAGFYVAVNKWG